ncbi:MAG TPA: metal ABC transporter permease [Candidatus Desulfaltia sp.]|nr:metal ABC transporter permease [Candidatus Desulfaltia sp.]
MEALFSYGFFQRALLAGLFVAVACAILGLFLLLRKEAMIGHGLAHVTFGGVALGLFLNVLPLASALVVAILASLAIMKLKEKAGLHGDAAIGIFSSVGMALGIALATIAGRFNADLLSYLFGDILAINRLEVGLSTALAVSVIIIILANYHRLMYLTFDRESAKVSGVKTARLDLILTVLTSVTVVLGMKVVGILLVAALLVIPAAAALLLAKSFRQALIFSCLVASLSVVIGLLAAFYLDLPASATVVLLSFLFFGVSFLLRRRRTV